MNWKWIIAALLICLNTGSVRATELTSIGVSVADMGNPFFVQIAESVTDTARNLAGDRVKVMVRSSAYDLNRQRRQIREFIQKKVDLIILTAADSVRIEKDVRLAQDAGIRVIAVDINAAGADVTITTDNVQAGEIACQCLAERLDGKGNVVIINGASISSVIERVTGCKRVLGRYPDIHLLSDRLNGGGTIEGGLEVMTYLVNAYDRIQGVFAINDPSAQGAVLAARQAGRVDFVITSVDGAPAARKALEASDSRWVASAAQFPRQMAELAVETGLSLLRGEPVDPNIILIPAQLITAENVAQYEGWGVSKALEGQP
ncbi:MAG: ABC transporter substrate-binding protein [Desulfosarcinaceae bacterium]